MEYVSTLDCFLLVIDHLIHNCRHANTARMVRVCSFQDGLFGHLFHSRVVSRQTLCDSQILTCVFQSFRGTQKGKGGHDEVARRIASNGQCWVEKSECRGIALSLTWAHVMIISAWRREDLQTYMFRLYLEFARVMSADRDNGKMVSVCEGFWLSARSSANGLTRVSGLCTSIEYVRRLGGPRQRHVVTVL